ncbi:hypothetical protein KCP73_15105 [Salmonella enterica subsp. enterica]|nr:hypothetical protein KCP73_15105 [Salmonella enterica subsp. enterica]
MICRDEKDQRSSGGLKCPYVEGLRPGRAITSAEAHGDRLASMVQALPQNSAPIRLIVPLEVWFLKVLNLVCQH